MPLADDLRTIGHLVGDSVEQIAKLVQNEANLAKAELSAKMAEAGRAVGYLMAATLFVTPAIVMLLFALAQFLVQQGLSSAAAHLVAAVVALVIGGVLAMVGIGKLRAWSPKPAVTVREIQRDVKVVRESVQ